MKTEARHCYISVRSIAPRCRKVAQHTVDLGNLPVGTTPASLEVIARERLAKDFKTVERATLRVDWCEIETGHIGAEGATFTSLLWSPFDSRNASMVLA